MDDLNYESLPLVSIYMPTHNRSDIISRAIDSVINQSYSKIELIICDDGSSDDTIKVIRNYMNQDDRIRFVYNKFPMGACFSRNRCIEIANGEFITGIDDDDEFTDERIAVFVDTYIKTKRDIISTTRIYKDDNESKVGDTYSGYINLRMMSNANWIGNQVFTRTSYLRELNGFDTDFPAWQDYDMWYRLVSTYGDCLKIKNANYIFYVDVNRPRITTGSRSHKGYLCFINKHFNYLSRSQKKNLYVQDILNRSYDLTFFELMRNITTQNLIIYIKSKAKKVGFIKYLYKVSKVKDII